MQARQAVMLPSASHVADYMLATARLDYDMELDQLQLVKLVYLTNGFVLQVRDEPAFHNPVEAWKYGPVVRSVREAYRHWGDAPIGVLDICRTALDDTDAVAKRRMQLLDILGREVAGTASGVLEQYGRCTGGELIDITHRRDTPWGRAYRPGSNQIIPTESIASFYRRLSEHNAR